MVDGGHRSLLLLHFHKYSEVTVWRPMTYLDRSQSIGNRSVTVTPKDSSPLPRKDSPRHRSKNKH